MKNRNTIILFVSLVLSFLFLTACSIRHTSGGIDDISLEEAPSSTTLSPSAEEHSAETPAIPPQDGDLVLITDYIPDIHIDLRYASVRNFTEQIIYDFRLPYLRYGTVKRLAAVQNALRDDGLSLLVWDAYRPVDAQYRLWEVCPDSRYVANPSTGYSSHSRGNTVDVALVRLSDGNPVELPTDFDDFSQKADRDYSDCSSSAAENARILENAMVQQGFIPYANEWWHFSDSTSYDVIYEFG